LSQGAPIPSVFSHRDHEGIIGSRTDPPLGRIGCRIDLVGDGSQRRGGGFRTRYFAHLLHTAPDTGGGQHTSISSSRQLRRNHCVNRTSSPFDFVADVRFVTQV